MKNPAPHVASAPALTARPTRARLQVRPRVRVVRAKSGKILRSTSPALRALRVADSQLSTLRSQL